MTPSLNLSKDQRLRQNRQFRQVYMRGRRLSGPHLTFYFMPNQLKFNRLGISVRKKRFKLSIRRHYLRRRLREAYRRNKMRFLPGYDVIISVRSFNEKGTPFETIKDELLALAQKARLLKTESALPRA